MSQSASRAFFWTTDWQASEQRATIDLLIGDRQVVKNAADMIRTLRRASKTTLQGRPSAGA